MCVLTLLYREFYLLNQISELKEEEFYNAGLLEQVVKEMGKDPMLIYPGGPPIQGFKGKSESQDYILLFVNSMLDLRFRKPPSCKGLKHLRLFLIPLNIWKRI